MKRVEAVGVGHNSNSGLPPRLLVINLDPRAVRTIRTFLPFNDFLRDSFPALVSALDK